MIQKRCGNCDNFTKSIKGKGYGVCETMDMRTTADNSPCDSWSGKKYNRTTKKKMDEKIINDELVEIVYSKEETDEIFDKINKANEKDIEESHSKDKTKRELLS